jgi:hypothetical protein
VTNTRIFLSSFFVSRHGDERERREGTATRYLCDAPPQEATLGLGARQLERALVLGTRLGGATETSEQVGTCRVEVLVPVEPQAVDEGKTRAGSVRLGHRDRTIQLDDR